jgi:hypothetical protein
MKTAWLFILSVMSSMALLGQTAFAVAGACSPNQMEADIAVSSLTAATPPWSPNAQWHYDWTNKRELVAITDRFGDTTTVLRKYVAAEQFTWKTSAQGADLGCRVEYMQTSMRQACGTLDGSPNFTIGGALNALRWSATMPASQFLNGVLGPRVSGDITVEGVSTTTGFLPVWMEAVRAHTLGSFLSLLIPSFRAMFMDVTLGIKNPDVFNPPASCN